MSITTASEKLISKKTAVESKERIFAHKKPKKANQQGHWILHVWKCVYNVYNVITISQESKVNIHLIQKTTVSMRVAILKFTAAIAVINYAKASCDKKQTASV